MAYTSGGARGDKADVCRIITKHILNKGLRYCPLNSDRPPHMETYAFVEERVDQLLLPYFGMRRDVLELDKKAMSDFSGLAHAIYCDLIDVIRKQTTKKARKELGNRVGKSVDELEQFLPLESLTINNRNTVDQRHLQEVVKTPSIKDALAHSYHDLKLLIDKFPSFAGTDDCIRIALEIVKSDRQIKDWAAYHRLRLLHDKTNEALKTSEDMRELWNLLNPAVRSVIDRVGGERFARMQGLYDQSEVGSEEDAPEVEERDEDADETQDEGDVTDTNEGD